MALAHYALNRRRLLAAGGITAAGSLVAACGGNTGRDDGGEGSLSQWYHEYGEEGTFDAAKRYADEYPDADVSVEWVPGDYDSAISSALLTDDGPDVFEWHFTAQMAQEGQVVALDDILDDVRDDFGETDLFENSFDGKTYGVKMINDPQFIYYRKSLLAEANLSVPRTWDEFIAAAQALTTDDMKGLFLGNQAGADRLARPIIHSNGLVPVTEDFQVGFNDEAMVDGMLQAKAMLDADVLLLDAPTEAWNPASFVQELCAMQWCGLWALPEIIDAHGDDVGVMPIPAFGGGEPTCQNGGWATFVSAKSGDVDAAKAFVRWLWIDQTDLQQDWSLSYGFHIPPRQSLAAQAEPLQAGPAAEVVEFSGQYGYGDYPAYNLGMQTVVSDMMNRVMREGADPRSELDAAVGQIQSELDSQFG